MFRKPFVVKKNVNMRNSDTRKLISRLPTDASDAVDKKAQVASVKILTYHNIQMTVYTFDKVPLFFDFEEKGVLYPTIFFLWNAPSSFPVLVVHEPVLQFLENGADLMLPGVIRSKFPLPKFLKDDAVAICLYSEGKLKGPVAVGAAFMSSQDMISTGFQGKGLQNLHVYHDTMWEFGSRGFPPTHECESIFKVEVPADVDDLSPENFPVLGSLTLSCDSSLTTDLPLNDVAEENVDDSSKTQHSSVAENSSEESMESLLYRCFIAGLKYRLTKSGSLPIDIGQFYAQCLLACVPNSRRLDMKKTKYKKFGVFIDDINVHEDGPVVNISKKGKGADMLSEVYWSHSVFRTFELTDEKITDEEVIENTCGPIILELYAVTEPVIPLFKTITHVTKGNLFEVPNVREIITNYVKLENLTAGKSVRMDPLLASLTKHPGDVIDWNTLMQKIQAKMTKTYVLRMPDGRELVRKLTMPKIVFKVESRAGNKKVTLINNVAVFGIEPKVFCQEVQVGVATSATITMEAVNCEGPQITVQGNQVAFLGDLLMNKYGINKKYIDGLDLAPKKKK